MGAFRAKQISTNVFVVIFCLLIQRDGDEIFTLTTFYNILHCIQSKTEVGETGYGSYMGRVVTKPIPPIRNKLGVL